MGGGIPHYLFQIAYSSSEWLHLVGQNRQKITFIFQRFVVLIKFKIIISMKVKSQKVFLIITFDITFY